MGSPAASGLPGGGSAGSWQSEQRKAKLDAVRLWAPGVLTPLLPWLSARDVSSLAAVCRRLCRPAQEYLFRAALAGHKLHQPQHEDFQFSAISMISLFNHACRLDSLFIIQYLLWVDERRWTYYKLLSE